MRLYTLLTLLICTLQANSQVFKAEGEGLQMYTDTTFKKAIGDVKYESCWCEIVQNDSSGEFGSYIYPKSKRTSIAVKKDGKWGAINSKGEVVSDFVYDAPVIPLKNESYGLITNTEEVNLTNHITPDTKIEIHDTSNADPLIYHVQDEYKGNFLVSEDELYYGIVNGDLKILLPLKYRSILHEKEQFYFNPSGLLTLKKSLKEDSKCGMVNYQGKIIFPFKYDFISDYISNEEGIFVQINDNRGFVDKNGTVMLPMRYKKLPYVLSDTLLIADDKYTFFINMDYTVVGGKKYQALDKKDSLYYFKRNDKWGVMNQDLEVIIPNQYESITDAPRIPGKPDFKCYVVVKNNKYGVISLTGEEIIPCEYNCMCSLGYFSPEGYFIEFKNGNTSYKFDENGELIEKAPSTNDRCLCEEY